MRELTEDEAAILIELGEGGIEPQFLEQHDFESRPTNPYVERIDFVKQVLEWSPLKPRAIIDIVDILIKRKYVQETFERGMSEIRTTKMGNVLAYKLSMG